MAVSDSTGFGSEARFALEGVASSASALKLLCSLTYSFCHTFLAARWATNLQRSSIALLGRSECSVMSVAVTDSFGAVIASGFTSAIVTGVGVMIPGKYISKL